MSEGDWRFIQDVLEVLEVCKLTKSWQIFHANSKKVESNDAHIAIYLSSLIKIRTSVKRLKRKLLASYPTLNEAFEKLEERLGIYLSYAIENRAICLGASK